MVVVSEVLHKRGLDFKNQRKVVILRDQGKTFVQIASEVKNLQGGRPDRRTCANYYTQFHRRVGRRKSNYKNCGRKPWKLSTGVKKFLVTTLLKQRKQSICTAATLQAELARGKGVIVEMCTIRKYIKKQGYRWLQRGQKRQVHAGGHGRQVGPRASRCAVGRGRSPKEDVLLNGRVCPPNATVRSHREDQLPSPRSDSHVAQEI